MKRAQGLPLNMVIMAMILLVLLVMLSFILLRQSETFTKGTSECAAQDGTCIASAAECIEKGGTPLGFTCPKEKPACCRF